MEIPSLKNIDHVHIYTKNRSKARQWYAEVLGFKVVEKYLTWTTDNGPLVMSNSEEAIHLAIFERANFAPSSIIAFGANGQQFLEWKKYLEDLELLESCKDHDYSWSLYFNDKDGNSHEITTEDYEYVKQGI